MRAYRTEIRAHRMGTHVRVAALVIGLVNTFFIGLDFYVFPQQFADFLWVRLILDGVLAWSYLRLSRTHPVAGQIAICVSTTAMLLVVLYGTGAPTSDYYVGLILFVMGAPVLLPLRASESALYSGVLAIGLALSPWLANDLPGAGEDANADWQQYVTHCFFLAGAVLAGIASSFLIDRARFQDFLQRRDLVRAHEDLRALDRAKSRFSANIHHELRTPLTLILSPLEALIGGEFGELAEAQRRYLETMRVNAQRLMRLIGNLLDLSKIESMELRLHPQPIQLARVVEDLVEGARPLAERRRIRVTLSGFVGLREINADLDAIEKILLNLFGNALKFVDVGGRVEISGAVEGDGVHITVSDDGAGIRPDQLECIFDRFAQADGSATRRHDGTGIGLSLAKELVELHGGRIWAESEGLGRGARFHMVLPRGDAIADARDAPAVANDSMASSLESWKGALESELSLPETDRPREHAPPSERRAGRPQLIVVEDNPEMRRFLVAILSSDYAVRSASNGREALETIRAKRPDLVLTDIMMPEMSGIDMCRELARDQRTCAVPVLLLTAKADREMKIEGLELGARDYVTKPFHPKELLARVRSIVQIEQLRKKLAHRNAILESTIYELKQTEVQLVQAERLAAVGELAAGIAHEVNNPVNFSLNSLRTLQHRVADVRRVVDLLTEIDPRAGGGILDPADKIRELDHEIRLAELIPELEELVEIAAEGLERTRRLAGDLQNFAGRRSAELAPVDVRNCLSSTIRLMGRSAADVGARIECDFDEEIPLVTSSSGVLNQVFLNLLKNATEALEPTGGTIRVGAHLDVDADEISITVADDGPGIDPEVRGSLFDPFVSTKAAGRGAGLGLSVCRRILGELEGNIRLVPTEERGATFEVRLPVESEAG